MSSQENTCTFLPCGSLAVESKQEPTPFLQIFWDLAEIDIKKREKATNDLVSYLRGHQDSAEQEQFPGLSRDMIYTLKRLCNGLCSPNDGARQGFSLALTYPLLLPCFVFLDCQVHFAVFPCGFSEECV